MELLREVMESPTFKRYTDVQKPSRHGAGQVTLGGSASVGKLDQMTRRGSFQPPPLCFVAAARCPKTV